MTDAPQEICSACEKPRAMCICDRVDPVQTKLRVVVLQHPQEDDETLGTAKLVTLDAAELRNPHRPVVGVARPRARHEEREEGTLGRARRGEAARGIAR